MGFLRFCRPASVRVCPPVALRLPGLQILGHLLAEGHQCRKVTDVNRSLLQPAAHTSNSITDTVAQIVRFRAPCHPKTHLLIKPDRLFILLIYIGRQLRR